MSEISQTQFINEAQVPSANEGLEFLNSLYSNDSINNVVELAATQSEQGVIINPEIVLRLGADADRLIQEGASGTEVAERLGGSIRVQQALTKLVKAMLEPDSTSDMITEWGVDEFLAAKCAVVANLQTELIARNEVFRQSTRSILENDLSYQDVLDESASAEFTISGVKYAHKLTKLTLGGRGEEVQDAAQDIKKRFEEVRKLLPGSVQLSEFADSNSWILWDIAKQETLAGRYESPISYVDYSGSTLGKTDEDTHELSRIANFMRGTVAQRHLGWELHRKALAGEDLSEIERLLSSDAKALLHSVGDEAHHGQLKSSEYADLGSMIEDSLRSQTVLAA